MRRSSIVLSIVAAALVVTINTAAACTTFNLRGDDVNIFGRNYDWSVRNGVVLVNKRGVIKTAMKVKDETGIPATWKSKYGSITFNQYGRELPAGGINEAGLVVEEMMLTQGQYPLPDSRPYIISGQFKQYLLDNFCTVKEIIKSDSLIRISSMDNVPVVVHFLVSDQSGDCAVIEFIGGKSVVYTGDSMPVRALTNSPYDESLMYWKAKKIPSVPSHKQSSIKRFIHAADAASSFDSKAIQSPVDYAFGILKQVAQGDKTKWSIIYDINKLQVFYHTSKNAETRMIDLKQFDFSCKSPVQVIDIDAGSGDISKAFQAYTVEANRTLIGITFEKTSFLKIIPSQVLDAIAAYPGSLKCAE